MTAHLCIAFEGEVYDPHSRAMTWEWLLSSGNESSRTFYRGIVEHGRFLLGDEPMPPAQAKYERARLLGTYRDAPAVFDPTAAGPVRALIPGLINHGTVPVLGGPPRVGKSMLVAQFTEALVTPGRRFLEHFEPANLTGEERERDVWLINAENPPNQLHEVLLRLGLVFDPGDDGVPFYSAPGARNALVVDHLAELGGPDTFDLSREENRDWWAYRLRDLSHAPFMVIADGVTAMLNSDTSRYGPWYSGFRRLLAEADIPSGLATAHTGLHTGHLMNGVESIAGPDGTLTYDASEPWKNPDAARYLSGVPRMLGERTPRLRVAAGPDGKLLVIGAGTEESQSRTAGTRDNDSAREDRICDALLAAGRSGLLTTEVTGRGDEGKANRAALTRLQASGRVRSRTEQHGRVRSIRWWLTEVAPTD